MFRCAVLFLVLSAIRIVGAQCPTKSYAGCCTADRVTHCTTDQDCSGQVFTTIATSSSPPLKCQNGHCLILSFAPNHCTLGIGFDEGPGGCSECAKLFGTEPIACYNQGAEHIGDACAYSVYFPTCKTDSDCPANPNFDTIAPPACLTGDSCIYPVAGIIGCDAAKFNVCPPSNSGKAADAAWADAIIDGVRPLPVLDEGTTNTPRPRHRQQVTLRCAPGEHCLLAARVKGPALPHMVRMAHRSDLQIASRSWMDIRQRHAPKSHVHVEHFLCINQPRLTPFAVAHSCHPS